ncbi:MAG: ribonuclease H-like domain-containing protein [Nitrospirales bacterium]|nr:ribonuclease H-like domain-containing protein [Nitrospira sp.]MDR4502968.1 ribonuclease H-like domain-containing protein [Nitrospirales bacterium]
MLKSTFILLDGIGESTEQRLWEQGIDNWEIFLHSSDISGIPSARKELYDASLKTAQQELEKGNARYFAHCLKSRDHWRLFESFRDRTAFLDIETNGAPASHGYITVVGIYGKHGMTSLIHEDTLTQSRLQEELEKYDLLVTFFGSGFDLPYIRAQFPSLILDHPHFDLCFAARRLGYKGGLKRIEGEFNLERPPHIHGLDGWDAVVLWEAWRRGDHQAGSRLLEYNELDVKNLEPLAEQVFAELKQRYQPPKSTHDSRKRNLQWQ